jgi:uncharacterized membrane protein YphA (DoxX/SURF4 family)
VWKKGGILGMVERGGRWVLGLVFLLAGLNGWAVFFGFSPFLPTSPKAMEFFQFPYLLFTEKSIEVIGGFLLLFNRFVPLTLAVLAPIVINIFLFHLFVDPSLLPLAVLLVVLETYLLWNHRQRYRPLLEA